MRHRCPLPADPDADTLADHTAVEDGVRALLRLMGRDPAEDGLRATPGRFLRAMLDLGTPADGAGPKEILATRFGDFAGVGIPRDPVTVAGVDFTSLCEHHLAVMSGVVTVAYVPRRDVLGLSKVPRLIDFYAARPQLQERLTEQIAGALVEHVTPDVAVTVTASHLCLTSRGARKRGAEMITESYHGVFTDPQGAQRRRFERALRR